ncbi:sugar ABC transporter permease [Actinophytocola sp.]|uniref:carbohydrate ABC transporter permease n=1 Tax=Actinophytocola sp. TaxID=1872138 RepID=UPI002D7FCFE5|nr:sugar ABC transporter permease [Actinophytocola sp.]HET9142986.1 sugar ABC transporter permease [Actinophytocola sp.]
MRARRRGERPAVAYLFLSPWVLGALLLTVGPMLASLYLSFTDYNLFTTPNWVGFANYRRLFADDPRFHAAVWVTLKYVLIATPLKLAAALAVALLLNRVSAASGLYRSAFYAPSLLGASVAVALVWRVIFDTNGVVDHALAAVGIDTGGWVSSPRFALLTIVGLSVWQFGAPMVIFLAGLKQIPGELYDASAVDGAGWWRTLFSVTLPMLSPVIFFNLVLETIHSFQAFTPAFVVSSGRGGPSDSTLFYTLYLYQKGFIEFRMGYASAMAWILVLVIALITALIFRTARSWVFYQGEVSR